VDAALKVWAVAADDHRIDDDVGHAIGCVIDDVSMTCR